MRAGLYRCCFAQDGGTGIICAATRMSWSAPGQSGNDRAGTSGVGNCLQGRIQDQPRFDDRAQRQRPGAHRARPKRVAHRTGSDQEADRSRETLAERPCRDLPFQAAQRAAEYESLLFSWSPSGAHGRLVGLLQWPPFALVAGVSRARRVCCTQHCGTGGNCDSLLTLKRDSHQHHPRSCAIPVPLCSPTSEDCTKVVPT